MLEFSGTILLNQFQSIFDPNLPSDHSIWCIADAALAKASAQKHPVQFGTEETTKMDTDEAPVENSPQQPPANVTSLLSVRNGYQEMRAMKEELFVERILSSGETVGNFLLRIWFEKEQTKKR